MIAPILVAVLALVVVLSFVRLISGPAQADRVVALELVISASVALIAVAALAAGEALLLDVAAGLALVGFVGTIAWARLIEAAAKGADR